MTRSREIWRCPSLEDTTTTATFRRVFTVSEANAMLPELRRLLQRLRDIHERVQTEFVRMEKTRVRGYSKDGNLIRLFDERSARAGLERMVAEGNRIIKDIQRLGCQVKDIDIGMIDFPSEVDGRPVVLCWRHDEPWVMYYHELDEGAAGRKLLPAHVP